MKWWKKLATAIGFSSICIAPVLSCLISNQTYQVSKVNCVGEEHRWKQRRAVDIEKLLRDNGTEWDYARYRTIEINTDLEIDKDATNRGILEELALKELNSNKFWHSIPEDAMLRVSYSCSKLIEDEFPNLYYFYVELIQTEHDISEDGNTVIQKSARRIVHIIPNSLSATRAIKSSDLTVFMRYFRGIFRYVSDGDVSDNLSYFKDGLKRLVHQNINSFYLNAPVILDVNCIDILDLVEDYEEEYRSILVVSLNKIIVNSLEQFCSLRSEAKIKFTRYSFAYVPKYNYDDFYSFNLGSGSDRKVNEEKIKQFLSNPLNMVSKLNGITSTIPLSSKLVSFKFSYGIGNDLYYTVVYDKHFQSNSRMNGFVIVDKPQKLNVKITGFKINGDSFVDQIADKMEFIFDHPDREYYDDESIHVRCPSFEEIAESIIMYTWMYFKDGEYVEADTACFNEHTFVPRTNWRQYQSQSYYWTW